MEKNRLTTKLRFGWTTGTCATAACHAAFYGLIGKPVPKIVSILTPSGKTAMLAVEDFKQDSAEAVSASIIKDAGDDPDVTHGAKISATLAFRPEDDAGIRFFAGSGVGTVTKSGLPLAVGEPAINPVPRQMMIDTICALAAEFGVSSAINVTISVENGAALALKTWNPRLGIEGGLSILGTSGVVRPYSCSAWIASIHRGVDVGIANQLDHMIATTGSTSERCALNHYPTTPISLLDMGDFIGGLLKYMRNHPLPSLTIAGGFAKLTKFAQGANDLHNARAQLDFKKLGEVAQGMAGIDAQRVESANTAYEVLQRLTQAEQTALCTAIAGLCKQRAFELLRHEHTKMNIMLVARDGALLYQTGF